MAITLQTTYDEARRLTQTNSNTLLDATLLGYSNDVFLDIERNLALNKIQVTGIVSTTQLVAGQSNYSMPADCFEIVHMEVNYTDPTDYTKWQKLTPEELPNLPVTWQRFVKEATTTYPVFDTFGGSFYIAPQPATTPANQTVNAAGLRLWYIQRKPDFVGGTDSLPYPFPLHWQTFSYGMAERHFRPFNENEANRMLNLYQGATAQMISALSLQNLEPVKTENIDYNNHGWQ